MAKKKIEIFATESDWSTLLTTISSKCSISLVEAGLFDNSAVITYEGLTTPRPLKSYLVVKRGHAISVRKVPQRNGGEKYAIDQLENPDSVMLHAGGTIGENRLVSGQIGTVAAESRSSDLYALFAKVVRSQFEKVKSYHVGPEAARLLDKGIRLSPTSKSPKEYDLVR